MFRAVRAAFSATRSGPYNPYRFKDECVPRNFPTNQEIKDMVDYYEKAPSPNVRNVRHINPVRQSGPLPPYSGSYTMEDIREVFTQMTMGFDGHYCQMDVDEVMRRVPGITRREVEHIVSLGLTPIEQLDFAYLAYNLGLDVFFQPNQVYLARQVVTNSKGDKVEVYIGTQAFEDLALLYTGFGPNFYQTDQHWEIFLWGDVPIKATPDIDLGVPNTWFEYECEATNEMRFVSDGVAVPEDIRPFDTGRNPHALSGLWKSQAQLSTEQAMLQESWRLLP
jgi:hypothetical protein